MYTHAPPFSDLRHDYQVIAKVLEGARPEWPSVNRDFEDQLHLEDWSFIKSCWIRNPDERPDIAKLVDLCAASANCTVDPPNKLFSSFSPAQLETFIEHFSSVLGNTPQPHPLSSPHEHSRLEESYITPYEMEHQDQVLPSTAIRSDIDWLMPNWPFINDASMEEAVYMPLSLLERDSVFTNSTISTRAGHDTSSISSFSSLGSISDLSSVPPSPSWKAIDAVMEDEDRASSMPLYSLGVIPEGVEEDV